jgi:type I restriction enzyme S subunit
VKKGWQWKQLGEVCETGSGGTPLKAKKEYYEGGAIPWLMSGEVSQGDVRTATKFITQKGLEKSSARMFPENTVLVAMYGATAGQVGILRFKAATNQAVCGILPNKQFVPEFLFYFLLSKKNELVAQATGNAQPNISQIKIRNTEVPLAPLPEQQRIVGILDEAFEGIATAKTNAEKNLQNARALFASHLQSVFTQRGEGWDRVTLETLLEWGWIESHLDGNHGGDYPRKEEFISEGVPYISANCLDDECVDMSRAKYLSPSRAALLRKGIAKNNDVLFAHNATVGPVAILRTDEEKVILGTSLTYYRCNPKHILPEYLAHYMRSFGFKVQVFAGYAAIDEKSGADHEAARVLACYPTA